MSKIIKIDTYELLESVVGKIVHITTKAGDRLFDGLVIKTAFGYSIQDEHRYADFYPEVMAIIEKNAIITYDPDQQDPARIKQLQKIADEFESSLGRKIETALIMYKLKKAKSEPKAIFSGEVGGEEIKKAPASKAATLVFEADKRFADAMEKLKEKHKDLTTVDEIDNLTSKVLKLCK